jgi:hypothetical protein
LLCIVNSVTLQMRERPASRIGPASERVIYFRAKEGDKRRFLGGRFAKEALG